MTWLKLRLFLAIGIGFHASVVVWSSDLVVLSESFFSLFLLFWPSPDLLPDLLPLLFISKEKLGELDIICFFGWLTVILVSL